MIAQRFETYHTLECIIGRWEEEEEEQEEEVGDTEAQLRLETTRSYVSTFSNYFTLSWMSSITTKVGSRPLYSSPDLCTHHLTSVLIT